MANQIFDALPGLECPVGGISRGLSSMWQDVSASGKPAPATEDAKATQVNFVLHLGFSTTVEDAIKQFNTAVRFSRSYPSRVVVLCPQQEDSGAMEIKGKVYGECALGKSKGDTRCCEFVMLSYTQKARQFLESQVSTCLSTDLPLYYWAHRFSASNKLADYHYLLTRSKRILIDSAIAPPDAMTYHWPRPEAVRDLVYARLLPVRQSVGQFLSRYAMADICEGLQTVKVTHGAELAAEGRVLLAWLSERVQMCGKNRASFATAPDATLAAQGLGIAFGYGGAKTFTWTGDAAKGDAFFKADFGNGRTALPATMSLLRAETALSEAMFF
jgi:glucose-6-phosphate dehydrogenase assembly protein OpcA